jgi:hypothetical protein
MKWVPFHKAEIIGKKSAKILKFKKKKKKGIPARQFVHIFLG